MKYKYISSNTINGKGNKALKKIINKKNFVLKFIFIEYRINALKK